MAAVPTIPQLGSSTTPDAGLSWYQELDDWFLLGTGSPASSGAAAELGVNAALDENAGTSDTSDNLLNGLSNIGSAVSSGVDGVTSSFSGLSSLSGVFTSIGNNPGLWAIGLIIGLFLVLLVLGKVEAL